MHTQISGIYKKRRAELLDYLDENCIDLILFPPGDIHTNYFYGILPKQYIISDNALNPKAILLGTKDVPFFKGETIGLKNIDEVYSTMKKLTNGKSVGIFPESFPLKDYIYLERNCKFKDISPFLESLRSVKDEYELSLLKRSAKNTARILDMAREYARKYVGQVREEDIIKFLKEAFLEGEFSQSFDPIVLSDIRTGLLSPVLSKGKVIQKSCIIDMGTIFGGYYSDISLSLVFGKLSRAEKETVETSQRIYFMACELIEKGYMPHEVFEKAQRFMASRGYRMQHCLGHGIGLKLEEVPFIEPKMELVKNAEFRNHMAFTIEAGVYSKGFGFKIENMLYLKNGKVKPIIKEEFFINQ